MHIFLVSEKFILLYNSMYCNSVRFGRTEDLWHFLWFYMSVYRECFPTKTHKTHREYYNVKIVTIMIINVIIALTNVIVNYIFCFFDYCFKIYPKIDFCFSELNESLFNCVYFGTSFLPLWKIYREIL